MILFVFEVFDLLFEWMLQFILFVRVIEFCFIRLLYIEEKGGEIIRLVWNSDGLGCLCVWKFVKFEFCQWGLDFGFGRGVQGLWIIVGIGDVILLFRFVDIVFTQFRFLVMWCFWVGYSQVFVGGQKIRVKIFQKGRIFFNKVRIVFRFLVVLIMSWRGFDG